MQNYPTIIGGIAVLILTLGDLPVAEACLAQVHNQRGGQPVQREGFDDVPAALVAIGWAEAYLA